MKEASENKKVFFEWTADSRYFDKKPASYFRAITVLSVLITLLLFFLKETALIFLVWILLFVVYVRATIAPIKTKYVLDKFGLSYYGYLCKYDQISLFSVVKKSNGSWLLRIITKPLGTELNIVLPDIDERAGIVNFLKEKIPFMQEIPKTETEKLADFLLRITGLG